LITDEPLIPTKLAEVTPGWLTAALATDFPGADVESLATETLNDGTAFTCRVFATYREGSATGPDTVCVKAGIEAPHRGFIFESGLCIKEAMVYQDVLPQTSARVAKCYAAGYEVSSGKGYVLLEDLTPAGAVFCGAEEPLTPAQVASGLEQLAELHALYWNDPRASDPIWRHRGRSLSEPDQLLTYFEGRAPVLVSEPHAGAIPQMFHRPEILAPALIRLRELDDKAASGLIHGDAHIGNFFLDANRLPCMADFQCVQRGHYSNDVATFMASSLDVLDRRRHERELVQSYLDALRRRVGTAPSFDEAWLGYRRHVLYGMWVWYMTVARFQSELRLVTCCYRFGLAALDLDSLDAINT
jgi:Phosphotransferase enzyme family